jgi:hypothetical protein
MFVKKIMRKSMINNQFVNKCYIDNTKTVHFVLGNSSGDLDSIVASISLAVLLNNKNKNEQMFL